MLMKKSRDKNKDRNIDKYYLNIIIILLFNKK